MILSIDAMGGDHAPEAILEGTAIALSEIPHLHFLLHGDRHKIENVLKRLPKLKAASTVCHSDRAIAMTETVSMALRKERRQSSIWRALESVKKGEAQLAISAGNTGVLMVMAKLILKTLPGIERPAIVARWPDQKNDLCLVLDLGATVSPSVQQIVQFAVMGVAAARPLLNKDKENVKVGLLNVGAEDVKGTPEIREAAQICQKLMPENFYGFVEGHEIGVGIVDIIVTDGFSGNIALKTAEGVARTLMSLLKEKLNMSLATKIGGLLAKPAFYAVRDRLEPSNYNGGCLLGLNGLVIKSHGGCDATSFARAIHVGYMSAKDHLVEAIAQALPAAGLEKISSISLAPDMVAPDIKQDTEKAS